MKTAEQNRLIVGDSEIDIAFINKVLTPYRSHCQYLKSATFHASNEDWTTWRMRGEFAIGQSCYIDDTGHFNAVEFNICYNQMMYVFLAHCIHLRILPPLIAFDQDTFIEKQLSNFLIASINSSYRSQLNAKHFFGEVGIASARDGAKCAMLKTICSFHDEADGRSKGEVTLAVLKP